MKLRMLEGNDWKYWECLNKAGLSGKEHKFFKGKGRKKLATKLFL